MNASLKNTKNNMNTSAWPKIEPALFISILVKPSNGLFAIDMIILIHSYNHYLFGTKFYGILTLEDNA